MMLSTLKLEARPFEMCGVWLSSIKFSYISWIICMFYTLRGLQPSVWTWLDIWVHLCPRPPVRSTSKTIFPTRGARLWAPKRRTKSLVVPQALLQGSHTSASSVQNQAFVLGCLHPLSICFRGIIHVSPIKIGLFPSVIHYWKPFSLTSRAWGWNIVILDRSWYFSMFLRNLSKTFFFYIWKQNKLSGWRLQLINWTSFLEYFLRKWCLAFPVMEPVWGVTPHRMEHVFTPIPSKNAITKCSLCKQVIFAAM